MPNVAVQGLKQQAGVLASRFYGEPSQALVERSDVSAVEALAVVAECAVAFELARAAREKFGGDALGDFVQAWRAYLERIDWIRR